MSIKIERIVGPSPEQWRSVIMGMRNPMNSWAKSDSIYNLDELTGKSEISIGKADMLLMEKLAKAGSDHRKYLRQLPIILEVKAPLYWWKETDQYKIGTVTNSCSTMLKLTEKPFEFSDFSFERMIGFQNVGYHEVNGDFEEEFRDIEGFEDYSISNKGRVFKKKTKEFIKSSVNSSNYKKVVIHRKNLYVHRLVAKAFCEKKDGCNEVNHIDGNKWNNNYNNLEWVTKSYNSKHAFDNGLRSIDGYTRYRVSRNGRRFTEEDIRDIKELYKNGKTKKEIANIYGCRDNVIVNLLNGVTYKKIELTPYDVARLLVDTLNNLRLDYLEDGNDETWETMIQLLPSSFNQKRTLSCNYEVLWNMYQARKGHKLKEWREFCQTIVREVPYFAEIFEI